ncbi:MAG: outer membrane beta-barrel protein, partial [Desulfobacterales bacterium]
DFDDNQSDQKWGGRGYLALIYSGEFTRADLSASYDVDAASGRRGAVERTRFVADVRHRFLEKLWLGISGGYYLNKSSQDEFAQDEIDERTVRVRPRFNWEIHRYVSLEGAYEYIYVDDNADDTDTDRHNVYLQVTFAYPVIE